jgi:oxygen-dependent protoporphyrinogen oxidase
MQQLVDAIAARLPVGCARLNSPVERIERDGSWRVSVAGVSTSESFDDLILTAPGAVSSRLLATVDAELASIIGRIEHAGCSVAILGYQRDQIEHPLDGFGFVVPAMERRQIIAGSLASVKFAGRAPEGKVLIRVFVGGALQPELGQQPDDQIAQIVRGELAALLGARGAPEFCDVVRWQRTMPQYHVGHLELVRQIEERAAAISNFALAGNAYRGVGIPLCVRSGEQAAERVVNAKMAISPQPS